MSPAPVGWAEQIAGGTDRAAEDALCRHFQPVLRMYVARHLGRGAAIDDVVQDCLTAVLLALRAGQLREPDKLGSFVFGIAKNKVRDRRRAEARRLRLDAAQPLAEPHQPVLVGFRLYLYFCLTQLTERSRQVLERSYFADRDTTEIAGELQLSVANVRVIRHRALGALRRCLEGGER